MFEEQALDTALHDRSGFDCGVDALNVYLKRYADQHRRRGVSSVFVLTESEHPSRILGYYTLSAAGVEVDSLSPAEQKRLPRYPVPCFRLGRLAVDRRQKGRGLGRLLLGCAVDRCLTAREQVAAYALVVDAKDAAAREFYLHHGFSRFSDSLMSLYLPLGKR
ncbi:MAG: GNAT family N-acetyltransferase [Lautropia sp.]|nr:GNAT family N-acetyltransferase [Lautropia sp.]